MTITPAKCGTDSTIEESNMKDKKVLFEAAKRGKRKRTARWANRALKVLIAQLVDNVGIGTLPADRL